MRVLKSRRNKNKKQTNLFDKRGALDVEQTDESRVDRQLLGQLGRAVDQNVDDFAALVGQLSAEQRRRRLNARLYRIRHPTLQHNIVSI